MTSEIRIQKSFNEFLPVFLDAPYRNDPHLCHQDNVKKILDQENAGSKVGQPNFFPITKKKS